MQSRRQFLGALSSVLGAGLFEACGGDGHPSHAGADAAADGGDGGTTSPAEAGVADATADGSAGGNRLEWLRKALRESPDHLSAQADALVAAGSARALFEFVRDRIRTLPPFDDLESVETAVRYGTNAVLRSGAGTPRERAELLAALLARAGHSASISRARHSHAPRAVRARGAASGARLGCPGAVAARPRWRRGRSDRDRARKGAPFSGGSTPPDVAVVRGHALRGAG